MKYKLNFFNFYYIFSRICTFFPVCGGLVYITFFLFLLVSFGSSVFSGRFRPIATENSLIFLYFSRRIFKNAIEIYIIMCYSIL